MTKFCTNCGKELADQAYICPNCGVKANSNPVGVNNYGYNSNPKSKIAAGLFGIFLGVFGVHNFYLGYTGKAIAQLLITLLSLFVLSWVSALWGLIEGILILSGSINTDAQGNQLTN